MEQVTTFGQGRNTTTDTFQKWAPVRKLHSVVFAIPIDGGIVSILATHEYQVGPNRIHCMNLPNRSGLHIEEGQMKQAGYKPIAFLVDPEINHRCVNIGAFYFVPIEQLSDCFVDHNLPLRQPREYVAPPVLTYFIVAQNANAVKIGKTTIDPSLRLAQLQIGCPETLYLLATIDKNVERKLHREFADSRIHTEWFRLSDKIVSFIKAEATLTSWGNKLLANGAIALGIRPAELGQ